MVAAGWGELEGGLLVKDVDTTCGVCQGPGGAKRPGYDFLVCSRCALPEPSGPMLGGNPSVASGRTEPWYHLEPQRDRDLHHDQPIVLNGILHFQQQTPVHTVGGQYTLRPDRAAKKAARDRAAAADDLAEHLYLLTEEQRAVVKLQIEGHEYPEIALALGIGITTVRERLRRARARLRARHGR